MGGNLVMNSEDEFIGNEYEPNEFKTIRDAYKKARRIERNNIVKKLQTVEDFEFIFTKENGEEAVRPCSAGQGVSNYSSQHRIKPYNLNNWQWISIEYKSMEFGISFNAYEQDSNTKNPHALFDRIAFWSSFSDDSKTIVFTEYDLPLSDNEVDEVVKDFVKFCKDNCNAGGEDRRRNHVAIAVERFDINQDTPKKGNNYDNYQKIRVYADADNIWEAIAAANDELAQVVKARQTLPTSGRKEHYNTTTNGNVKTHYADNGDVAYDKTKIFTRMKATTKLKSEESVDEK
jgi:hypothetical protein